MAKRTEDEWRALFQQHDESGLTAAQFCRDNKLCSKYFSLRRKQLSGGEAGLSSSSQPFVPARIPAKSIVKEKALITLKYQSCQLQMPVSISEQWLAGLLKALA